MYIKITRFALAGNIGALGAMGFTAPVAAAAFAARFRSARYPNPHDNDCSICRRFISVSLTLNPSHRALVVFENRLLTRAAPFRAATVRERLPTVTRPLP